MIRLILPLLCWSLTVTSMSAEAPSWSNWRGPLRTGFVPEGNPPIEWDEQTNVRWKTRLPGDRGSSTPAVAAHHVFVQAAEDTGRTVAPNDVPKPDPRFDKIPKAPNTYHRFILACYDLRDGKELWKRVVKEAALHEGHHPTHSFAGFSPVTDGERVYAHFGSQGVYAFTNDGEPLWDRQFPRQETRRGWGEGGSIALHDGILVIPYDHEGDSFIIALNAKNGETIWKQDRDEVTCWSTPLVLEQDGRTQVIVNGTGYARSYDLKTGEVIWKCAGQTVNAIPAPVADEKYVYCMSGYRGSFAVAIPRDATGDVSQSSELAWTYERGTPYVPSPLLMGGRLYFTQGNNVAMSVLDAHTGKVLMDRERLPGLVELYASPVGVKDRIYVVGRSGTTNVIKAGVDTIEVMARNRLDDEIDASPVVVGDQLLLRGHQYLYCISR